MKIVILPSAMDDLAEGFLFYEKQEEHLGNYFLDSIFADMDSLSIYGGIHRKVLVFIGCWRNDFLMAFVPSLKEMKFAFAPFSMDAAIRNGFRQKLK